MFLLLIALPGDGARLPLFVLQIARTRETAGITTSLWRRKQEARAKRGSSINNITSCTIFAYNNWYILLNLLFYIMQLFLVRTHIVQLAQDLINISL